MTLQQKTISGDFETLLAVVGAALGTSKIIEDSHPAEPGEQDLVEIIALLQLLVRSIDSASPQEVLGEWLRHAY